MINYDKNEIKEQLTLEQHFELLSEWGGNPEYTNFGIISETICHNEPGEGSRKLYLYSNSWLYICYTGCEEGRFDIFELVRKVAKIQWNKEYDLNEAVRWVARRFNIAGTAVNEEENNSLEDWKIFADYDKYHIEENLFHNKIETKVFDDNILNNLNYSVKIQPWLDEGITQNVLNKAKIGYYPGGEQITIPHYNQDGKFIGLRGRSLIQEEAELYGKYRPIKINKILYNHPLGSNLYGYNWNKENIKKLKKVIVFESEKSVLLYASYFGWDNNIAVACCGSNLSAYQVQMLLNLGVEEIIIAFDRQFQEIGDKEFNHLTKNLIKLNQKYKNIVNISFIFDKKMITRYKASPIDEGKEKFIKLFMERIIL